MLKFSAKILLFHEDTLRQRNLVASSSYWKASTQVISFVCFFLAEEAGQLCLTLERHSWVQNCFSLKGMILRVSSSFCVPGGSKSCNGLWTACLQHVLVHLISNHCPGAPSKTPLIADFPLLNSLLGSSPSLPTGSVTYIQDHVHIKSRSTL